MIVGYSHAYPTTLQCLPIILQCFLTLSNLFLDFWSIITFMGYSIMLAGYLYCIHIWHIFELLQHLPIISDFVIFPPFSILTPWLFDCYFNVLIGWLTWLSFGQPLWPTKRYCQCYSNPSVILFIFISLLLYLNFVFTRNQKETFLRTPAYADISLIQNCWFLANPYGPN
jgi:hypothetical protein